MTLEEKLMFFMGKVAEWFCPKCTVLAGKPHETLIHRGETEPGEYLIQKVQMIYHDGHFYQMNVSMGLVLQEVPRPSAESMAKALEENDMGCLELKTE